MKVPFPEEDLRALCRRAMGRTDAHSGQVGAASASLGDMAPQVILELLDSLVDARFDARKAKQEARKSDAHVGRCRRRMNAEDWNATLEDHREEVSDE